LAVYVADDDIPLGERITAKGFILWFLKDRLREMGRDETATTTH